MQLPISAQYTSERALGMNGSGSVVVGSYRSSIVGLGWQGYRWRSDTGFESLQGVIPQGAYLTKVSDDGSVIAGTLNGQYGFTQARPYYWTASQGVVEMGLLPGGTFAYATGLSADGTHIAGYGNATQGNVAWKWSAATGYSILTLPTGFRGGVVADNGVSDDGRTIAVRADGQANYPYPMIWRDDQLIVGSEWGLTSSVQRDGMAVFYSQEETAKRLCLDGTIETLGTYPGALVNYPLDSSGDANVIVGTAGLGAGTFRAWYWTPETGLVDLKSYLNGLGVDTYGWTLTQAVAVSADGRTILGLAEHPSFGSGTMRSFVLTIPCVPTGAGLLVTGVFSLRRSRRR